MDELKLIPPTKEYSPQIESYRQEFLENGDSMDGTCELRKFENPSEWLEWLEQLSAKESCPEDWLPGIQFICVRNSDDRLVGMINIRPQLNEYLFNFGGNIGYSVRKSERRKGYATAMLALCLVECRKLGLERVLVTCDKENIASAKTMINNGAVLENEVAEGDETVQRYWIEL